MRLIAGCLIAAVLLAGLFAWGIWGSAKTAPVPDFGPLPAITVLDENGQPFAGWQSLPQPALIVTLWASWCTVCMAELPKKIAYATTHPNVALVAISIDTDSAAMAKARKTMAPEPIANITWLHDADKSAYTALQASGVPETFIADKKRHLRAKQNGPTDLQYGPLAGAIEAALKN